MTHRHDPQPQPGVRVVVLDDANRVLLVHAHDPDQPTRNWWELPGGALNEGEDPIAACCRELAEETGIQLAASDIQRRVWIREARFIFDGHQQHRLDTIYLARLPDPVVRHAPRRDELEQRFLGRERWWSPGELATSDQRFLPGRLPRLLADLLGGRHPGDAVSFYEDDR